MLDKKRFREQLERSAEKSKKQFPFALSLALISLAISVGMILVSAGSSIPLVSIFMAIPTVAFGSWAISLWHSRTVNYEEADAFIERINARGSRQKSKL